MKDPRPTFSSTAWRRPLLALLAGFALAFGMVAPHDVAVEQTGKVSRVEIAETAVHPGAPAHFEDAEYKIHPGCAACLLQLGSSTILARPLAPAPPRPQGGHTALPIARIVSAKPSLPGPARAPPIASPFA
jgi:hypothetical protein